MKVLLITDNHTPTGGAEKYFFELKNRLATIPNLQVFSLGFGPKTILSPDSIVLKANKSKASKLLWQCLVHPLVYLKLRKLIKKIHPDVIHLHNTKEYTAALFLALRGWPLVQTIHDYSAVCPTAQNLHKDYHACETGFRWRCFFKHHVKHPFLIYLTQVFAFLKMTQWQKKQVRQFYAPSPLLADYLQRNNFQPVYYVPPFKQTDPIFPEYDSEPNQFLFAGNLGKHKGIYILVKEFALACAQNKKLMLTIAGTGAEETKLRQAIQSLNIEDNVNLIGWVENLNEHYQKSIAVIFPSLGMESFGLVMMDAMTAGRVVIGSDRGTPPWLIDDGQTGYIFNPLKPGDLAKKILACASNMTLTKQMGANARDKIKQLINNEETLQAIIGYYHALYYDNPCKKINCTS